jgi:dTMP kinase
LFISLEGGEGSGKSTQAAKLAEWLVRRGIAARLVREPGSTEFGECLRRVLVGPAQGAISFSGWSEALLYTAARAELVREVVRPALEAGIWVVADRYIDSTLAYQGYGLGLAVDHLRQVNEWATGGLWPDLTFLFDVSAGVGMRRSRGDGRPQDRIEARGIGFHEQVNDGYRRLAAAEPTRWRVVPAAYDPDQAHALVISAIQIRVEEVQQ